MYSGAPAAKKLCTDYGGSTVHRRSLVLCDLYIDFHLRLSAQQMASPCFNSAEYYHGLGREFGGLTADIFEEFVRAFMDGSRGPLRGRPLTKVPILFAFAPQQDLEMYKVVARTKLFSLLRYMMSKFTTVVVFVIQLKLYFSRKLPRFLGHLLNLC